MIDANLPNGSTNALMSYTLKRHHGARRRHVVSMWLFGSVYCTVTVAVIELLSCFATM